MEARTPSSSSYARTALLALFLGLLCVGLLPAASASADTRAVLSWDTDDTDVDLHIWDQYGNHAYFGDQTAIFDAELTTDILFGFGPEEFFEYSGSEGRTFTYGVCYYGSNQADGSVPETVATVELTDPDGTTRTLKRRLRAEKDAYILGASPANAPMYNPPDGWCGNGPAYGPDEDGGVGAAGDGGQTFEPCTRVRRRIGVVELCSDNVSGAGSSYRLDGNVRMNGSVAVSGPLLVDTSANTIRSDGDVGLSIARDGTQLPVASGGLLIDPSAAKDDVSGRTDVAVVDVSAPVPHALKAAGLDVTASSITDGKLKLFLDRRDGGGLVMASRVSLPLAGQHSALDAIAIGAHGRSKAAVRVLGGSARFGEIPLGATGWKFSGLELSYNEAEDRWTAKGGFATPAVGLDVNGSLVGGRLDSIGLSVARDVPLGQTGFILSSAGGEVKGLVQPPLKIALTTSGRWGSVPGLQQLAIIHLKGLRLEIDVSGRLSFKGAVSLLMRDGSPVIGTMQLGAAINPFSGSGSMGATAKFHWIELDVQTSMKMNARHFTALGRATGKLRGAKVGEGRGIVSDAGAGGFGEICVLPLGSRCLSRASIGFGMAWRDWPSMPKLIGADINRYATVSSANARAARRSVQTITVRKGRPLLAVDAMGSTAMPTIELRSPTGRKYTSARPTRRALVETDPARNYTGLTILSPQPGRWKVFRVTGGGKTRVQAQTVPRMQRVTPRRIKPATSRKRRLAKRRKAVTVSWTSRALGPATVVDVYVSKSTRDTGRLVSRGRSARGAYRLARKRLTKGANYVHLVVRRGSVVVDQTRFRPPIWVR